MHSPRVVSIKTIHTLELASYSYEQPEPTRLLESFGVQWLGAYIKYETMLEIQEPSGLVDVWNATVCCISGNGIRYEIFIFCRLDCGSLTHRPSLEKQPHIVP